MTFNQLAKNIDARVDQTIGPLGFKWSKAGTWVRVIGERVDLIWLQARTGAPLFCVNLGVHYTFLPQCGTEAPIVDYWRIEYPECEIKLRLEDVSGEHMQWWPFSEDSVALVSTLIAERVEGIFAAYDLRNVLTICVDTIRNDQCALTGKLVKVRAALLMARIHEHIGNKDQALVFARFGIEVAGMAVGPKRALKDLISRNE